MYIGIYEDNKLISASHVSGYLPVESLKDGEAVITKVEFDGFVASMAPLLSSSEAHHNLQGSDWKVSRHKEQLELGIATSLTVQEYQDLLQQRQAWRDLV
tara:strand:- start:186 stop:485 length:300 start_codon:yes stop_codon:yes gene_type:complete